MRVLMKKIQSTCNLCALACNIDFHVENGKIEKVSPTVDYPVNQGFCCIKGLNLDKQQTKIKARKTRTNWRFAQCAWAKKCIYAQF
jgi:assimilatory nitrate reductase catalytic subunit